MDGYGYGSRTGSRESGPEPGKLTPGIDEAPKRVDTSKEEEDEGEEVKAVRKLLPGTFISQLKRNPRCHKPQLAPSHPLSPSQSWLVCSGPISFSFRTSRQRRKPASRGGETNDRRRTEVQDIGKQA